MSSCGLDCCLFPKKRAREKGQPKGTVSKTTDEIRSQLATIAEEFKADGQRWKPTTADLKVCFARNLQRFESMVYHMKQDFPMSLSQLCRELCSGF